MGVCLQERRPPFTCSPSRRSEDIIYNCSYHYRTSDSHHRLKRASSRRKSMQPSSEETEIHRLQNERMCWARRRDWYLQWRGAWMNAFSGRRICSGRTTSAIESFLLEESHAVGSGLSNVMTDYTRYNDSASLSIFLGRVPLQGGSCLRFKTHHI